jgi:hypothetical protein
MAFARAQLLRFLPWLVLASAVGLFSALPAAAQTSECEIAGGIALEVPFGAFTRSTSVTHYVSQIYQFLVGSVGVISAVMIMFNGLKWAAAAGNMERISQAKDGIVSAIIGLVIALLSYTALYSISPATVNLADICPTSVELLDEGSYGTTTWSQCPGGTISECNAVEYCQFEGGCNCVNVGDDEVLNVCQPIGTDVIPTGYACKTDDNCKGEDIICSGASDDGKQPGVCTDAAAGTKCETDDDCEANFICVDIECGYSGTCVDTGNICLPPTGRSDGEYCQEDSECASNLCVTGGGTGVCADGEEGNPCASNISDQQCLDHLKCESNVCTAKVEGDSCESLNDTCSTGPPYSLFCVDSYGFNECYDGSTGDPCGSDSECQSGTCNDSFGQNECL